MVSELLVKLLRVSRFDVWRTTRIQTVIRGHASEGRLTPLDL